MPTYPTPPTPACSYAGERPFKPIYIPYIPYTSAHLTQPKPPLFSAGKQNTREDRMKYLTIALLTLTACGDEMPDKRVEQNESRKSNAQMRADELNRQRVGGTTCHACNDNAECYCWWEDVDGQPACVEVDRGLHQAECAQFLIDEYCGFYPHEKECQEDK